MQRVTKEEPGSRHPVDVLGALDSDLRQPWDIQLPAAVGVHLDVQPVGEVLTQQVPLQRTFGNIYIKKQKLASLHFCKASVRRVYENNCIAINPRHYLLMYSVTVPQICTFKRDHLPPFSP